MMRLVGSDGALFEMSVVGYEFPEATSFEVGYEFPETARYDDANRLAIQGHVVHPGGDPRGEWFWQDYCLQTYEVERLAKWFTEIARGSQVDPEEDFLEPHLQFRLTDQGPDGKFLEVYFQAEARPSWASSEFVKFPISEVDLATAAEELRGDLAPFPQRTWTIESRLIPWREDSTRMDLYEDLREFGAAATLGPPGRTEQHSVWGSIREILGFYDPLGTIDIADGPIRKVVVQRKQMVGPEWGYFYYRATYQVPDSAITEGFRKLRIRLAPVRAFVVFGEVEALRWKGRDLSTGLIDRLTRDSSLKRSLEYHSVAGSLRIKADVFRRCWLMSSEWKISMSHVPDSWHGVVPISKGLWECYQHIARHLLAMPLPTVERQ